MLKTAKKNKVMQTLKLIALCVAVVVLAACGRDEEPEPAAEPVTLTMVSLTENSNGEESLLETYTEANQNVTIERGGYTQFPSAYLLDETPPDIMAIGPSNILASAGSQNLLADLTDLWAQNGLLESYPASFRELSEVNGKQYFVPTGYSWVGIYYNVEIFNRLGLEPPQTWDELMSICDRLLAGGETPFSLTGFDPSAFSLWFDYLNLRLNGPEFHRSLIRGNESYDDPRVREVFDLWESLFAREYFIDNAYSMRPLTSLTAIIRGDNGELGNNRAVMVLATPFGLTDLPDTFRGELDFFRFPIINPTINQGEVVPSIGYMVPANAPKPFVAMDLVAYLSSAEAQTILFPPRGTFTNFVPANSDVVQDNFSQDLRRGIEIVQSADQVTQQYFFASPNLFQGRLVSILREFFLKAQRDGADIDKLLLELEDVRQTSLAEQAFSN